MRPPSPKDRILSKEEVSDWLTTSQWECAWVKDYPTASLWRTKSGYYFSVPSECTEKYFEQEIVNDLHVNGWKRNV